MYGLPGGGLGYESYVALVQNAPRLAAQRQADIAAGIAAAFADDPAAVPPLEWFEAVCDDDTEARIQWQKALQRAQVAKSRSG